MAHSSSSRRPSRHPAKPSRQADPVRLAALRAYAAFRAGGTFRSTAPPSLIETPQRRLYANLLRGMVRHQRWLEAEASRLARRPAEDLSPPVMAALVLGLYQVLMLQQADHAAVFETVETLGAIGQGRAKGLVNAVLRSALRERPSAPEGQASVTPIPARPSSGLSVAVRTSHPDWLVERWVRHYGAAVAERICEANNLYETTAVRINGARISRDTLIARLAEEGVEATPHPLLPGALLVHQVGALLESAAFTEGLCYVQDAGSQLVSAWIAPLLTGRLLDACCAPGGKLTHLLELSRSSGTPLSAPLRLVGMDSSPERLRRVRQNLLRLRLSTSQQSVLLVAGDAAKPPFVRADNSGSGWDAVLLDVPCSATGMIRKYPELKWRKHEQDLVKLAAVQRMHLDAAAEAVRPGGLIAYVTCSLEPEENERQVEAFLMRAPGFRRVPLSGVEAPAGLGVPAAACLTPVGDIQLLPDTNHMGIYGALLRREPPAPGRG